MIILLGGILGGTFSMRILTCYRCSQQQNQDLNVGLSNSKTHVSAHWIYHKFAPLHVAERTQVECTLSLRVSQQLLKNRVQSIYLVSWFFYFSLVTTSMEYFYFLCQYRLFCLLWKMNLLTCLNLPGVYTWKGEFFLLQLLHLC